MPTATDTSRELKGLGQQGQKALTDLLVHLEQASSPTAISDIQDDIAALGAAFSALTAKLDADAGITDTDYNTLDPTLNNGA